MDKPINLYGQLSIIFLIMSQFINLQMGLVSIPSPFFIKNPPRWRLVPA